MVSILHCCSSKMGVSSDDQSATFDPAHADCPASTLQVLVVCEGEQDVAVWDHLVTAEMLMRATPAPFGERHLADVLLVHEVPSPSVECTARIRRAAELVFGPSPWTPVCELELWGRKGPVVTSGLEGGTADEGDSAAAFL